MYRLTRMAKREEEQQSLQPGSLWANPGLPDTQHWMLASLQPCFATPLPCVAGIASISSVPLLDMA